MTALEDVLQGLVDLHALGIRRGLLKDTGHSFDHHEAFLFLTWLMNRMADEKEVVA